MTIKQALRLGTQALEAASVPDAAWDAALLLAHVTSKPALWLRANGFEELGSPLYEQFDALIARRAAREPLQYILGSVAFEGVEIAVSPDALIPRMDTEVLFERTALRLRGTEKVLDLCTGTGVLAIALKHRFPSLTVFAADKSDAALALAQINALRNQTAVHFRQGDLFEAVGEERFDLILSNPPYICAADMRTLQEEVLREPRMALFGGEDGLDFYRRIVAEAPNHLVPGGALLFEIACSQAADVSALMASHFDAITVTRDLSGLDRCVEGTLRG